MTSSPWLLSLQLYSLRHMGDLPVQLDIARDSGFRIVETIGSHLTDAAQTRALLDARGLAAMSGHVSMDALRDRFDETVSAARTVGISLLAMPALPPDQRDLDAEGWRAVGAELGGMAARMADDGLTLAYHNHDWEMRPLADGTLPLAVLLDAGAQGGLCWQADLAWVIQGDQDPAVLLDRFGDRLASVHVKDIAPAGEAEDEDGWADVGHGTVDWAALWRQCGSTDARLMVAEHDNPSDGARFARRSFAAMDSLAKESAA